MKHFDFRRFFIDGEKHGEALVLRPECGCDRECVAAMDGVISHTGSSARRNIILDASRLSYIETPGFKWMLRIGSDLQADGGMLIVVGLIGPAERAFKLLQLSRFIKVAVSVDSAFLLICKPASIVETPL